MQTITNADKVFKINITLEILIQIGNSDIQTYVNMLHVPWYKISPANVTCSIL